MRRDSLPTRGACTPYHIVQLSRLPEAWKSEGEPASAPALFGSLSILIWLASARPTLLPICGAAFPAFASAERIFTPATYFVPRLVHMP